ncbi:MAG TPA: adenosylcobinamide-phosphate synthase CbiB [Polyangiaceae bacterium]|nr:adenosylcobinamide-phosphate synthase CbiB [Polyangiaceae bacterium]
MSFAIALALASVLDLAFGEPRNALHPVAWLGRLIARGRDWALAADPRRQFIRGGLVTFGVSGAALGIGYALERAAMHCPVIVAGVLLSLLLKPLLAIRALGEAALAVRDALTRDDLDRARQGLASLCSRDASSLSAPAIAAAAIESLAENASDSIVAPVFFFGLFGLPGAAFYRAANTLDAMIGYRGRFEWVGKIAARLDDVLNIVPARITAALLLASGIPCRANVRDGLVILFRDGSRTESPNAGRPMAAMAGLLGVELAKTGHYVLGDAKRPVEPADITRAWRLVFIASFSAVLITAGLLACAGGNR